MVEDARYRTIVYLEDATTGLISANLTKHDGITLVRFNVMFAEPNYLIEKELSAKPHACPIDLLFLVGTPDSTPLVDSDHYAYGYTEHVPITTCCVDKTGITGTKLLWKTSAELRRITENYPTGSLRTLEVERPFTKNLGSTILYQQRFVLNYRRDTT